MPSPDAHLAAARSNYDLMTYLRANRLATDAGWVAVIAFYTALHVVEAVFATLRHGGVEHTATHYERRNVLRNVRQYLKLWQHCRPLHDAASDARYLEAGEAFHMTPAQVESILIDHHLKEILAYAQRHAAVTVP
jgi:hypothetical protein